MQVSPIYSRARTECRILEKMQLAGNAMSAGQIANLLDLNPKAVRTILRDLVSAEVIASVGKATDGPIFQLNAIGGLANEGGERQRHYA